MKAEELIKDFMQTDENFCIIDDATRSITVAEKFKLLGVESDEKVKRIKFKCSKIVGDNTDLSQLRLYVHYRNSNKEEDSYLIEDVKTIGEEITFSWLLSRKVTKYVGNVQFIVSAKKSQADGTLTNEWNTTLNKDCNVLEGLPIGTPPSVEQAEKDIIEQLLNNVRDTSKKAVEDVKVEGTKQKQILDTTVEEIKSDREQIQKNKKDIENLEQKKANAIVESTKGNPVEVGDSDNFYLVNLEITGSTTQGEIPSPTNPKEIVNAIINKIEFGNKKDKNFIENFAQIELSKWDKIKKVNGVWKKIASSKLEKVIPAASNYSTNEYIAVKISRRGVEGSEALTNYGKAYVGNGEGRTSILCSYTTFGVKNKEEFIEKYSKGVQVLYQLENVIYEDIPQETQTILDKIQTFYPNITIQTNEGITLDLSYVANTKLYIDKKIKEIINNP